MCNAYADAAPDLVKTVDNATKISDSIVDENNNLDALLVSAIGLADVGNEVVGSNRQALTDVLHLLVPTTDLLNQYNERSPCGLAGVAGASATLRRCPSRMLRCRSLLPRRRALPVPGQPAQGRRHRRSAVQDRLPEVPFEAAPPFVVADIGANPCAVRQPGHLLNSDGLKQVLFGPIDGPPRNTARLDSPDDGLTAPMIIKFGAFGIVMVLLTVLLFFIFGQYRTGSTNSYSAVFTDASRLKSGRRCGSPVCGSARSTTSRCTRTTR